MVIVFQRNFGMESSKGDYFAFCDDDDIWHEDKLIHQIKFIEKQKKLMKQREDDFNAQKEMYAELDKKNKQLEKERKFLETRFNKTNADGQVRDLGDLANKRPISVERILNKDWDMTIRCNEIAQGSPLTEQEVAVKLKTDPGYNSMCSPTANPNYEAN